MKVKQDFVTNSSSTSFILAVKDTLSEKQFYKGIGLTKDNDLKELFKQLYRCIDDEKELLNVYVDKYYYGSTVEEFLNKEGFDSATIKCVLEKMKSGEKVYYGKLHSDGGIIESFFACESFIIDNESIYLNGEWCIW